MGGMKLYTATNFGVTFSLLNVRIRKADVTEGPTTIVKTVLAGGTTGMRYDRSTVLIAGQEKSILRGSAYTTWMRSVGQHFIPDYHEYLSPFRPSTGAATEQQVRATDLEGPYADLPSTLEFVKTVRGAPRFAGPKIPFSTLINYAGGVIPNSLELTARQLFAMAGILNLRVGPGFFASLDLSFEEMRTLFNTLSLFDQAHGPLFILLSLAADERKAIADIHTSGVQKICALFQMTREELLSGDLSIPTHRMLGEV